MGAAAEGKSLEALRPYVDKFNGSFDLDKHLAKNNIVTQMKADITATLAPGGGGMTVETEESFKDRIEAYAESETATPAGRYYNDNIIKKQDIVDRLTGLLGTKESKSFKYKPTSGGIYAGKKQDRKDRTQKRYETEKAILLDPRSQKAQEALGSLVGVKVGKGVNTAAEYSFPEDYDEHRKSGSSLTDYYDSFKDETTGLIFKDNVFEKGAKDQFNAERAKLGLSEDVVSVKIDPKNKNIITVTNNKAQSKRIDMSKPEAVEDYLLGDEAKWKNDAAVKITYVEDGRTKTRYLGLDPVKYPDSFSQLNTMQNIGAGEGMDVVQEDLRTLKEKEPKVWGGKGQTPPPSTPQTTTQSTTTPAATTTPVANKTTQKKPSFEEYEKTAKYKSVLAQAKKDYPNATEAQIIKSIKAKY
jgi:hypothetical protein